MRDTWLNSSLGRAESVSKTYKSKKIEIYLLREDADGRSLTRGIVEYVDSAEHPNDAKTDEFFRKEHPGTETRRGEVEDECMFIEDQSHSCQCQVRHSWQGDKSKQMKCTDPLSTTDRRP